MDFCLENDLPEDVVVPLINHIRENLKQSCVKVALLLQLSYAGLLVWGLRHILCSLLFN